MKNFSSFVQESLDSAMQPINECVVAAKQLKFGDDNNNSGYVLIKHRDRAYKPTLSIIHTVINGIEIVLFRDDTTLWAEGLNSAGIAIVNSALGIEHDEEADKIMTKSDKAPKMSMDGERIQKALTMNNIDDAVHFAKTWKGGINGNTLISDGDDLYIMELNSRIDPVVTKIDGLDHVVRTNHGIIHSEAGYQEGPSRKSSESRKANAELLISKVETQDQLLSTMRTQVGKNTQLNPLRKSGKLFTSSQIMMNPKELTIHVALIKKHVENFKGVVNQLPTDYEPKIEITFEEI